MIAFLFIAAGGGLCYLQEKMHHKKVEFESWVEFYNKSYANETEKEYRQSIFETTAGRIDTDLHELN